jgi:hypothetical protein
MKEAVFTARLGGCGATICHTRPPVRLFDPTDCARHQSGFAPLPQRRFPEIAGTSCRAFSLQTAGCFAERRKLRPFSVALSADGRTRPREPHLTRRL